MPKKIARWSEFVAWATEGGYDESYFNTKDSKCEALYERFLEEAAQESCDCCADIRRAERELAHLQNLEG